MKPSPTLTLVFLGALSAACSAGSPSGASKGGIGGDWSAGSGGAALGGAFSQGGDAPNLNIPNNGATGGRGAGGASTMTPPPPPPSTDVPVNIDECAPSNTAGLDAAATQKLMAGSGGPGNLRLLNPYDGTVFPRGLIAPLLMWDGTTADVVYLHVKSNSFEYKGCLKPTGTNQLQFPQSIWSQASAATKGEKDPFTVELTVSSGGVATGPVVEKIVIAQATIKGSVFYNTYATKLGGGMTGGAILRIRPGQPAELYIGQSGCTGCHTVSASGTRLTAVAFTTGGATYTVSSGAAVNPPPLSPTAPDTSFTALSPDGSIYVTNAHQGFPPVGPRTGPTSFGTPNAAVYDTATGAAIANTGVPTGTMTPAFSPDGSLLAFTDYALDGGRGLALMNFDQKAHVASGYKQIYHAASPNYPGWPFVLPDDKGVIFAIGALPDFSGGGAGITGGVNVAAQAPASDLYVLDIASGQAKLLARAMGFGSDQDATSNKTYLPFGAAEEVHHNYYPTLSPVAAGGYFWIFFDSFRHYGNLGLQRQLWGTAVDISADGTYVTDPSHPPFYLTGQEFGAGNHRAFTALDPCLKDGNSCTTGIDCCGGFCTNGSCGRPPPPPPPPGEPPPPPSCASTDEACTTSADCCDKQQHCISGFCGVILR